MFLAINGGKSIRTKNFPAQETYGDEERSAIDRFLMGRKQLSGYQGNFSANFWGGKQCQELEKEWAIKFDVKYALAVNSCTSALQIACGAVGIEPGDEVIVTPWSMSCSATAPMIWGGVPVFADIEKEYFCLCPDCIEKKITEKTKAIIVVDLFGQPYDPKINEIAKKYNLKIIEDAAQAIGSTIIIKNEKYGKYAGTIGDMGCYSLTQGKHLTSGEGGMIVTNDHDLYMKCALIRNHAEAVISSMPDNIQKVYSSMKNMVGFNMRLTEIQAVIAREQLKKLDRFVRLRQDNAEFLNKKLSEIPGISKAEVRENCVHSYYVLPFFYDEKEIGIRRDVFIEAVKAELGKEDKREDKGVPISCGYIKPLYRMPLFQNNQHWSIKSRTKEGQNYLGNKIYIDNNYCRNVESLWKDELFLTTIIGLPLTDKDRHDIVEAFQKVYDHRKELKE